MRQRDIPPPWRLTPAQRREILVEFCEGASTRGIAEERNLHPLRVEHALRWAITHPLRRAGP